VKKYSLIIILFIAAKAISFAQINDAQLWENIYLEKNITKRVLARVNHEGRISDNITNPSFYYFDIGVNYDYSKHFHFSLAYVIGQKEQNAFNEAWSTRHQAYATVTMRKKFGKFAMNDRQMIQWQVQDIYTSLSGKYPQYMLRNKFTVKYDKWFKWQPYISDEIYYQMNQLPGQNVQYHFNRNRTFFGLYYNVNLINQWELYYLIEDNFNQNILSNHPKPGNVNWVIGVGYSHTF
jgi:hypothetical protein